MLKGEDILIKNNYLYAFNFAPTIESHRENLKDGDGFEIMHRLNIGTLTREQIKRIQNGYRQYSGTFSSWIEIAGFKIGRSGSSNELVANRESNDRNDNLDSRQSQKRTGESRDNRSSSQNYGRDLSLWENLENEVKEALG